jgi:hypothetical protein
VQAQQVHERLADICIDLYVSSCVLARLDHLITTGATGEPTADIPAGKYFLKLAFARIRERFDGLDENNDAECVSVADGILAKY